MRLSATLRWCCFAAYAAGFFTLPPSILWGLNGALVGGVFSLTFLILLRYQGPARIAASLSVEPLTRAEAPHLYATVQEYARRLGMPAPNLGRIPSPSLNVASFGFSRSEAQLVVTDGALARLSRDQLSALVGREMASLWYPESFLAAWLCRFLAVADYTIRESRARERSGMGRRVYPFRLFLRQVLLYPLTMIPIALLRGRVSPSVLDAQAARLTRHPRALAEGLRLLEASSARLPLFVPFSARHLFLLSPPSQDPLARVFFGSEDLTPRIEAVEGLTKVTALA